MSDATDIQRASGVDISQDVVTSMCDLFALPKAEFSVESVYTTDIGPASSISATTTVIDFFIPGEIRLTNWPINQPTDQLTN